MRLSLEIVVIAIVLIVVAAVVLAVFGEQIFRLTGWTHEESLCISDFVSFCQSMEEEPGDWNVPKYRDSSGQRRSCAQIMSARGGCECKEVNKVFVANCPKGS